MAKMKLQTEDTDIRYMVFAETTDGRSVLQHVGCDRILDWIQARSIVERFRKWKRGWIGKREFPVKSLKLVEIKTNRKLELVETTTSRTFECKIMDDKNDQG